MSADRPPRAPYSLWGLVRRARPSLRLLGAAAAMALLAAAGQLAFPMLTRELVDDIAAGRDITPQVAGLPMNAIARDLPTPGTAAARPAPSRSMPTPA